MTAAYPSYAYGRPITDPTPAGVVAFGLAGLAALLDLAVTVLITPALDGDGDAALALAGGAGLLEILALVSGGVAAAVWLHQVRRNSELLEPDFPHARSAVWVWLGWIVPVVALWFPYQVVRDVHRSVTKWSSSLIGWWWGLWLSSVIWGRIAGSVVDAAIEGDAETQTVVVVCAIGTVLTLGALVLWGLVIRLVTDTQIRAGRGEPVTLWADR